MGGRNGMCTIVVHIPGGCGTHTDRGTCPGGGWYTYQGWYASQLEVGRVPVMVHVPGGDGTRTSHGTRPMWGWGSVRSLGD